MAQTFSTGNATVRTLDEGTILRVVGKGVLQVVDPAELSADQDQGTPEPGDVIETKKHGIGQVVRMTSLAKSDPLEGYDGAVLYIGDDDPNVVRIAEAGEFGFAS